MLLGMGMEEMYLAGMLEKIGARADFIQVGAYKGAQDPLTRTEPSPEWSENIDGLLDDLYGQAMEDIAEARGLTPEEIEQVFIDCWAMQDADFVKRKVVDSIVSRDLVDATELAFGDDFIWDQTIGEQVAQVQSGNPASPASATGCSPKTASAAARSWKRSARCATTRRSRPR